MNYLGLLEIKWFVNDYGWVLTYLLYILDLYYEN